MRIVVTGAAGFLGSHLVERLLGQGHEVVGVDSLVTGSEENLASVAQHPSFRFMVNDVTDYLHIPGPIERIYHLASPASPKDFARLAVHILKVGSLGVLNALGLARAKGARFLTASSSEVYGDAQVHPQNEAYWGHVNPIGERSMYDEAKRFSEAMTIHYGKERQVQTRIIRIFNTFGPRMRSDDGRVIPQFIEAALDGRPLSVYGDGRQTRSFCFVDDLLEGMTRLMESTYSGPVNIGNPDEITIGTLAQEILHLTGRPGAVAYHPLPKDDPVRRKPDITLARRLLGWAPRVSREEGLRRTIEYFRGRRKGGQTP